MLIQVLIAPPASGKTYFCIQQIRQVQAHNPLAPVWVLVPDRWQVADYRRRLAVSDVVANVRVQTSANLYQEILEGAGQFLPIVSTQVVHQVVRAAVKEVHADQPLQYYASLVGMPGFTRLLQDLFFELKRSRLDPDTFAIRSSGHGPELEELARLYRHYQEQLQALGWKELQGLAESQACNRETPRSLDGWMDPLVVDGFSQFNTTQKRAMAQLGLRLPRVLIILPGRPDMSGSGPFRQAHRRFQQTLKVLETKIPGLVVIYELTSYSYSPKPLADVGAAKDHNQGRLVRKTLLSASISAILDNFG